MWRELFCAVVLIHATVSAWSAQEPADAYPNRTIKIIDGFAPGGSADYLARVIAPKLSERLGQPVIVENRAGAAGNIGAQFVARSNPDGYTLLMGSVTALSSSPSLYRELGYDLLKDFSYVTRVGTAANVLVAHPSIPAKSIAELAALSQSKPETLRYGSAGLGSPGHLLMEQLQTLTRMQLLHVPYKGGAPAIAGLLAGDVQLSFSSITAASGMIRADRLKALATSGANRSPALPQVPTIVESGVQGFEAPNPFGLFAPARTPAAVVNLLNSRIGDILKMDDVKAKFAAQGFEAMGSTPDEFRAITEAETKLWARVVKEANISIR
jgi:tripartite-type tricarboxylate transporter receptor subunit TctC